MGCNGERAEFEAEPYLNGSLPEERAAQFEEHYFDCEVCFERVQLLQIVRVELAKTAAGQEAARQEIFRKETAGKERGEGLRRWVWIPVAAAAVLLAGVGLTHWRDRGTVKVATTAAPVANSPAQAPVAAVASDSPDSPVELAALAEPMLPPFSGSTLRGADDGAAVFAKGMAAYQKGRCGEAAAALESVPSGDSFATAARLYAGACRLKVHARGEARKDLQAVVDAGDTPQLEYATFLLAQAELELNKGTEARNLLRRTIALHGSLEARAKKQLAVLDEKAGQLPPR